MSVTTSADDNRDKALKHITEAILRLDEIIVKECWGYYDYTEQYRKDLDYSFNMLREIKRLLK